MFCSFKCTKGAHEIRMENVASVFIYHGVSVVGSNESGWIRLMGQGGKGQLCSQRKQSVGKRCMEWLLCHVSALLHQGHSAAHPGYPTALCNHSWAVSWVGHAVFVLRGHSWPGIHADLALPDSLERTEQCWRAELSSRGWRVWRCGVGSVLWAVGGCREISLWCGSAFPRQPSSLQEHRRRCGCRRRGCCATARASASSTTRTASLGSADTPGKQQQKCPPAIFSPD